MTLIAERFARPDSRLRERVRQYLPRWQWLGLGAIVLVAAGLDFLQLAREGYANSYYASAVRSMLQSWHNFFFVSFDPGGFVTVDKPPVGFWLQTASAKLFGFHGWSLLAPQALAGVLSVGVLFFVVRRVFGPVAGLLAALALAVSPVSVATNRNNTIDSLLVLTVLLAAWAALKATEHGRLRWLLLSMALVGIGFNIKALEAFLVLPALTLVYFLAAPVGWRKRILHLAVAGVVLTVVSLSWVMAVDLTPASQRPYVGSSQHNSELELALGYNGLQRLLGGSRSSAPRANTTAQATVQATTTAVTPAPTSAAAGDASGVAPSAAAGQPAQPAPAQPGGTLFGAGGGPGGVSENGPTGVFRLFDTQLGGQIAWLIPVGLLGLLAAWRLGFRRRPDAWHQSLIVWGTWFLTGAVFFSRALFFHRYYLSMLAPAVAALFGIGAVTLWQAYRRDRVRGWLLPLTLLVAAAAQVYILHPYTGWNRWVTPLVVAPCVVAALMLAFARLQPRLPRLALVGATAVGLLALLVAPAIWAGDTVRNNAAASGVFGGGPRIADAQGFGGPPPAALADLKVAGATLPAPAAGGPPPGFGGPGGANVKPLEQFLLANQGSAKYLVAVSSSQAADQLIIDTGKPVMAIGGFSGGDPILTAESFAALVKQGQVRYVQLGGMGGPGGGQSAVSSFVQTTCAVVPASQYSSATGATATDGATTPTGLGVQQLYDCAASTGQ